MARPKTFSTWFLVFFVTVGLVAYLIRAFVLTPYGVKSEDFQPTLMPGDWVLVLKRTHFTTAVFSLATTLKNDDLVVFYDEGRRQLGRIQGFQPPGVEIWSTGGKVRILPPEAIMGRIWLVWFSVEYGDEQPMNVRWNRVLRGIK